MGFDPYAFVSAPSFELGRELLGVRPSHGLAFLQWGAVGAGVCNSTQEHWGGVFRRDRGSLGLCLGRQPGGRTGPLHSKPAVTLPHWKPGERLSGPWGSTCCCGKVVRGTDTIFKNPGSPALPCGLTQAPSGVLPGKHKQVCWVLLMEERLVL